MEYSGVQWSTMERRSAEYNGVQWNPMSTVSTVMNTASEDSGDSSSLPIGSLLALYVLSIGSLIGSLMGLC
jgi:hypothetical protein